MGGGWWMARLWAESPPLLFSWCLWVVGSICLHELAHGWTAIRLGDETPSWRGHMTWDPLVHMGPFSLVLFALVGIAWGMMPVDPTRMRGRYAEAIVAVAGPATNLGLAIVAAILGGVWATFGGFSGVNFYVNFLEFCYIGVVLNLVLMMFNLVPFPPLDGYTIAAMFFPGIRGLRESGQGLMFSMVGFMLLFGAFGRYIWGPAQAIAHTAIYGISGVLGGPPL